MTPKHVSASGVIAEPNSFMGIIPLHGLSLGLGGSDGSTVSSIDYTLDACGRVTEKDEYNVGETDYTYDAEAQLTQVDYPSGETHTFTYDDNGNRTEWARSSDATISYIYNAADQLTQSTEGTIGTTYSHDNNGNLTGETTGGVAKTFAYDPFDRMTSVSEGRNTLQSMSYGPDGKRLSLTDASGTRKFFYDRNDVIQEYDSDWSAVTREYTHGPWVDEPLSMTVRGSSSGVSRTASETYYLMKDRLGSIINIMDASENLKTTYSYDAFGQPTATYYSGQVDCMYRFTGRVYDGAMGNYFYRARYYNQSLGRFFSRDPIFSLSSLYAYCHNSPANFTDPSGLCGCGVGCDQFQPSSNMVALASGPLFTTSGATGSEGLFASSSGMGSSSCPFARPAKHQTDGPMVDRYQGAIDIEALVKSWFDWPGYWVPWWEENMSDSCTICTNRCNEPDHGGFSSSKECYDTMCRDTGVCP